MTVHEEDQLARCEQAPLHPDSCAEIRTASTLRKRDSAGNPAITFLLQTTDEMLEFSY